MRSAAWALATSSRCSASVRRGDPGAELVDLGTRLGQRLTPVRDVRRPARHGCARHGHGRREPRRDQPARLGDGRRNRRGVLAGLTGTLCAHPGLALGRRRPAQRIRPSANGIRAFLGGANRQPGLDLGGARGLGGGGRLLTIDRLGVEHRGLLRIVQPGLELGELFDRAHPARLELVALRAEPLPFVLGGPGILPEPAELFVDRGDRGVGFVQCGQRLFGGSPAAPTARRAHRTMRRSARRPAARRDTSSARALSISDVISRVLGLRSDPP